MHESISEWWKKICRPTASFKEGWTVMTGTICGMQQFEVPYYYNTCYAPTIVSGASWVA